MQSFSKKMKVQGYAAQQAKAPLTPYSFERRETHDHDVVIDLPLRHTPSA
jgi:hypothetical protein